MTQRVSFRDLPALDKLLSSEVFKPLLAAYGHQLVSQQARLVLEDLRQNIQQNKALVIDLRLSLIHI